MEESQYGLCLPADEMSKIELLCLKKGVINNKCVVSEKWLEENTIVRLRCGKKFRDMKYGYLWWIIDENKESYVAIGNIGIDLLLGFSRFKYIKLSCLYSLMLRGFPFPQNPEWIILPN